MREYGRHIQKMVEHLMSIEDKERRQRNAQIVIELMGFLNPHLKNVEDFRPELNLESFGNALDVIVLEQEEVQRSDAGTDQNVSAGIAAQVETQRGGDRRADAGW